MVEVSLTVGKLDASLALLLTKDHHLIEFPTILLPNGVKAGSIVKIRCEQDFDTEKAEHESFQKVQDEILSTFGKSLPQAPVLKVKNVTQTSCVLEWDVLDLGTASLKNLILYKDGKKLGSIPQPLTNRTTKLSGLPIDKPFEVQVKLDTTAGIYASETVEVTTHKMTDLSGITVCLGDLLPNDVFDRLDIELTLATIGARRCQDKVQVDTTHFLCTRENKANPEYLKAQDMNIPIIRPEWLKACERERRIVGVTAFYLKECVLPDILAKNYWGRSGEKTVSGENSSGSVVESQEQEQQQQQEPEQVERPEITGDVGSNAKANEANEANELREQVGEPTGVVAGEQSIVEKIEEKEANGPESDGNAVTGAKIGDGEMEDVDLNNQNDDVETNNASPETNEKSPHSKPEPELEQGQELAMADLSQKSEAPEQPGLETEAETEAEPEPVSKEELKDPVVTEANGGTETETGPAKAEPAEPAETEAEAAETETETGEDDTQQEEDPVSNPQDTSPPPKSQQKKKKKKKGKK
jgi:hypothetical protein